MKLSLIQIVEGIVALLALFAVLAFIFPLPFKAAADFLGFDVKLPGRAFTPYESSDVAVIESLNGLRCAFNSVAAGTAGKNYSSICPPAYIRLVCPKERQVCDIPSNGPSIRRE